MKRWVVVLLSSSFTVAQAQNPFFEAARENAPAAQPSPAVSATAIARAFSEGCVAHEGDSMKTVDWAINQGYEWVDAHSGPGAALLSGQSGTVLAMPGSAGQVLLAIDLDKRCTVWAERADGPALRAEFMRVMNLLAARGARLQPLQERTVERGGAWRMQVQMRYRRAGGAQDFGVGAVTTMTPQPAAQVLSAALIASRLEAPATDPMGLPAR